MDTISALILALIVFIIVIIAYIRFYEMDDTNVPDIILKVGASDKSLASVDKFENFDIHIDDLKLVTFKVSNWGDNILLNLTWFVSFMEKDFRLKLPNEVGMFDGVGEVNICMNDISPADRRERKYEKIFLQVDMGGKYLTNVCFVVWYSYADYLESINN